MSLCALPNPGPTAAGIETKNYKTRSRIRNQQNFVLIKMKNPQLPQVLQNSEPTVIDTQNHQTGPIRNQHNHFFIELPIVSQLIYNLQHTGSCNQVKKLQNNSYAMSSLSSLKIDATNGKHDGLNNSIPTVLFLVIC